MSVKPERASHVSHTGMSIGTIGVELRNDEKKKVGMADLEYACDKIGMGPERKSAVISPENLKLTAYHEAGHAVVALRTPGAMPVHKATIVPRGNALGMVAVDELRRKSASLKETNVKLQRAFREKQKEMARVMDASNELYTQRGKALGDLEELRARVKATLRRLASARNPRAPAQSCGG